jgi:hypothetical protein
MAGEFGEAAKYLLRLKHPESTENRAESVIAETRAPQTITDSGDAKLTESKSFTTAPTVDVNVGPIAANGICQTVPDQQEIERRRDLVRVLFNDFWSGAHNKPSAFAQRLDQAEDYLNARLAAHGEFWRLDGTTRAILGLPPRSSSPDRNYAMTLSSQAANVSITSLRTSESFRPVRAGTRKE